MTLKTYKKGVKSECDKEKDIQILQQPVEGCKNPWLVLEMMISKSRQVRQRQNTNVSLAGLSQHKI